MNNINEASIDPALVAAADQEIARLAARLEHRDVPYEGGTVRWYGTGQGRPLVLVHGGHGRWLHWLRNIDALSRDHQVWVPDLPSYGASSTLPEPAGLPQLLRATIDTLDQLVGAGTSIDLAGFSFGGVVSANIAAQRGNVRRLAFVGSGGHGTPRRQSLTLVNWRRSVDERDVLADLHHNLLALMLHDEAAIDPLALAIHRNACLNTRFRSKRVSQGSELGAALQAVEVPIRFLWGEHDVTAQPGVAAAGLIEGHAQRRLQVIEGAGHWAQFERADAVNRALGDFFG